MHKENMLDALFPKTRQIVLAKMLLQPDRSWYLSDLAHTLQVGPSSLQRELASLTEAGMLIRESDGNRVYYHACTTYPIFGELRSIFLKTVGLADRVCMAIEPYFDQIDFAFIYGSIARGERTSNSDVDVMIVGTIQMLDLSLPLRELERLIEIPVNVTLYSREEFAERIRQGHHFTTTVMNEQKIFLKGNEDELAVAFGFGPGKSAYNEQAGDR